MSTATLSRKWTLSIGRERVIVTHKGKLTSRNTTYETHESLEDCKKALKSLEKLWNSMNYYVLYAYATGPNREKVKLHQGTNY